VASDSHLPPSFPGFPDFQANVTFVPIQFFTVVLPHSSRGAARIVGYALRKILGWVDEHGNPTREQSHFTYRELIEKAGVSREAIADAFNECIERHFLRCVQPPRPDRHGRPGRSGLYELCWDKDGPWTHKLEEFKGFFYREAAVVEVLEGAKSVWKPKTARKNIPNAFFDDLLPRERLALIRLVAALMFYSIQWGPGGERKVPVSRSITELSRLTRLSRQQVHSAVMEVIEKGYIEQVEAGCFDKAAGKGSRAATYGIRWATSAPAGRLLRIEAGDPSSRRVADDALESDRSEKVNGRPVRNSERNRSEKVNGERSEKVNAISVKTELKTEQTATVPSVAADSGFDLLRKAGFDSRTASRLAAKRSLEAIEHQIAWLPLRRSTSNRLGLLRCAIEEDWPKPAGEISGEHLELARGFASHYYSAYHGYDGEAATEPLAKDLQLAAKFIQRLDATGGDETQVPGWGRRFGAFIRQKHRRDEKARPVLSVVLVLYGDEFLRMVEREKLASRKEALGKAREARQAVLMPDYLDFLRDAERVFQRINLTLYATFTEQRQLTRRAMNGGLFLASANTLARFDSEESRLQAFADFFHDHPQCPVPDLWQWDKKRNSLANTVGNTASAKMPVRILPLRATTSIEGAVVSGAHVRPDALEV